MVDGEPAAGAPEPCHDLVADHQDPEPVAQLADALRVAVRRDQDPVGARDRLEDERRNRRRTLELDRLLELRQCNLGRVRAALYAVIRVEHVYDPTRKLVGPAARVAGGLDRAPGRPVVGAVAGQDLRPARHRASDLDRVLVGVRPGEREQHLVDVSRQQLGQLLPQPCSRFVGHERRDVGELLRLPLDRVDDPAVAMAGVDGHQLAVEVDEAAPVDRGEVHALRARHRHRLQPGLGRPVVERVPDAQLRDLLRPQRLHGFSDHWGNPMPVRG